MRRTALALALLLAAPAASLAAGLPPGPPAPGPPAPGPPPPGPPAPAWPRYRAVMWQDLPPAGLAGLAALGITATKLLHPLAPDGRAAAALRLAAGLRWYDENLATDFYAPYHRWRPDRPVTWAFDQVRARHAASPDDPTVFDRSPSLSDPAWLAAVRARLTQVARQQAPYRPLFLNLGDETGIADLAAAWDFDRSPASLAAMRVWLRDRLGTLDALNRAWGTQFAGWDDVVPATTDEALRRDAAVPSWMAFKQWMDVAFARAVRAGAEAVHEGDRSALAGLEGAQVPGWGGYDYARLAPAVDVMEIYDDGNAVEIARSFNPTLVVLTTSASGGEAERHRLWHEFLLGGRGVIVWDDAGEVIRPDGTPGPRGTLLAPLWRTLGGALGSQILDARPLAGQVAILSSQASFRLGWLLARRREATPWEARDAEAETADNPWRAAGRRAARLLAGLGAQPRWIAPEKLVSGTLERDGTRVLVLPHSQALSDAEVAAIRRFAAAGGLVLADIAPGERDEAGRPRPAPPLADLAASGRLILSPALRDPGAAPAAIAPLLAAAGVRPPLAVLEADGSPAAGLDIRLWHSGAALIAGIQRQDAAVGDRTLTLRLASPLWVQPLGGPAPAAPLKRTTLRLDPVTPALLVLSQAGLPGPTLSGPAQAVAGETLSLRIGLDGPTSLAAQFGSVQVRDPAGRLVSGAAATVRVPPGGCTWSWRLPPAAGSGTWQVKLTDAASGGVARLSVRVR